MRALLSVTLGLALVAPLFAEPLTMQQRYQQETSPGSGRFHRLTRQVQWQPEETAIIVCDVWDLHHCLNAVRRVGEFAPRLNEVLKQAREAGVTIIHSPSDCMPFYRQHPARLRALSTPVAESAPQDIAAWCSQIPQEEAAVYPLDQSDGGEDDDSAEHAVWVEKLTAMGRNPGTPWKRQTDLIHIDNDQDYISDRGDEVWNVLESRNVKNVILAGVHVNMCVLGRPFGLRQMVRGGKNVVLMRDMTDAMYNPQRWPYVSHFTGNDLIISHIERFVCPTVTSDQIVGGSPFRFRLDRRPHVAIVMAEDEYELDKTLPEFAARRLGRDFRVSLVFGSDTQRHSIPGLDVLQQADVMLLAARRRLLPPESMRRVRDFVRSGKPVIGVRTANHAFSVRGQAIPDGLTDWASFDQDVFGGNYSGHYPNTVESQVRAATGDLGHSLLAGLGAPSGQAGSLYKTSPLKPGSKVLLVGQIEGQAPEPVAWTYHRDGGGKSFYTSMGHPTDFQDSSFVQLLENAIYWAADIEPTAPHGNESGHWQTTQVPEVRNGTVWYRCAIRFDSTEPHRLRWPEERNYQAWLNGTKIVSGHIPKSGILPDEVNLIVVRTEGGLSEAPRLIAGESRRDLDGRWQYRVGDDDRWSNIPLPARFGISPDIVFQ